MLKNFKIMLIVSVISIICGGQVAEADALWARDANTSTLKPKIDANDNVDIGDGELDANNVYIGDTLFTEYISGTATEVRDVYLDPNLFVTGDLRVNGGDIGIAADPDLIHMSANNMTVRGAIVSTLDMIVNGGDIGILTDLDLMKLTPNLLTVNGAVKTTGDLKVDGGDIGITADTDLIQLASGALTVNGSVTVGGKISNVTDPTADQDAATKKYVDDQISTVDSLFGSWTSTDSNSTTLAVDEVYKAGSDGFVCVYGVGSHGGGGVRILTDSSNPPTTARTGEGAGYVDYYHGAMCPVKKEDYWKVERSQNWDSTPNIYWIPIGNGSCEKQ